MHDNVITQTSHQLQKGAYIINQLAHILYQNNLTDKEYYNIIKGLKEQILGFVEI